MTFLEILERVVGRRSQRSTVDVWTEGKSSLEELGGLAKLTQAVFRQPVDVLSKKKTLNILMMSDINPDSGKVWPDYLERRRKAKERPKELCAGTVYHDAFPHDG